MANEFSAAQGQAGPSGPRVSTRTGPVDGITDTDGISSFVGIPYAEPPTGDYRFKFPQPHAPWQLPRPAKSFGATAPQRKSEGAVSELIPNVIIAGDEYLNLNVWTPDVAAHLPVMVFIHGGSFAIGSGAVPGYNGSTFARDGIVFVSINYRLGVDGFLWFGEGPANLGLLDQIAALHWVQQNVAAFGGDPSNVTVFGESAGAMSVATLLAMPAAAGLFHRAIMDSGPAQTVISAASAVLVANRLADILGIERSRDALKHVPIEELLTAQAVLAKEISKKPLRRLWGDVAANGLMFEPVIDGETLKSIPIEAISKGSAAGVDLLVGYNSEEGLFLLAPTGQVKTAKSWLLYVLAFRYKLPFRAIRTYRTERPDARPGDLLSDMMTDWIDRIPTLRIAEAHPDTHVYEFAWRSPAFEGELGASHGMELPFVFDNVTDPSWHALTLGQGPQALADIVHKAWVDFAKTGAPGWRPFTAEDRAVMRFDVEPRIMVDERRDSRELWEGRR